MKLKKDDIIKEIFALSVSGYGDFVDRKSEIIANLICGAPTLESLVPMTGAKAGTTVELNMLSTAVTWQGGDCVTTATGTTTLAPRSVAVKRITDREELCLDKLDAKLPMIQKAGARNEELPFAQLFMDLKVANNSKQLEKLAWRGSLTGGTGNLGLADGWIMKAEAETSSLAYYSTITAFTNTNDAYIISKLEAILTNRSDEMREMETTIWCSPAYFSIISKALRTTYGMNGTGVYTNAGAGNLEGRIQEMWYPGENVLIKATHGLSSNDSLFCTFQANLRYVTDMESDKENVELFFDKYHKALVSDIIFSIGFQYEMPEHVIYMKKI